MRIRVNYAFNFDVVALLNVLLTIYIAAEVLYGHTLISQASLLIFAGCAALLCFKNIRGNIFSICYAVIILWSVIMITSGCTIRDSNAIALTKTMVINLVFIVGFSAYYKTASNIDTVLEVYKISAIIVCIPAIMGGAGSALSGGRLEETGVNANFLGTYIAVALMILIYQAIRKIKRNVLWNSIQFCLFVSTIILSGSRSAFLLVAVGVYILLVFRKSKKIIINTALITALLIGIMYLIMNVPVLYGLIGYRFDAVFQYLQGGSYEDFSLDARVRYIELGWKMIRQNPYWGYGADCFRTIAGQYAHNNFIELLFSFGIMGLVYYIPGIYCIFKLIRNRKNYFRLNAEACLLSIGLIVSIYICDYSRVTYYQRIALLPLVVAVLNISENGSNTNKREIYANSNNIVRI